ncbi:putative Calmodulin-binding domain, plant [Rosa chinensis]|uniref:Putative Calmodulin-binding domain, plant n=1 Tax=Rosa chinensis TaxID=74649 RepID=A0A2P6P2Y2_ROSCH|nr:putative Calmodulin-binding domain, plant [Rosa chinensis]
MEVENIGIPVILQDLKFICDDGRRNSISVIPQEKELNGSHIRRHSIALVPQEMESTRGDIISNSIPVIQQEIEPNGDEIGRNSIPVIPQEIQSDGDDFRRAFIFPQKVESNADESDDVSTNSIPVIPQEVESNVDESNDVSTNSIPVIPQEMELEGNDIGRNSIPVTPQEIELDGDDIRRSSIGEVDPVDIQTNSTVILQKIESNGGDVRRNSIAGIPQEIESEDGDIRRNSIIVIPVGIEASGADVRRRSIARNIQSRYLRASMGSCHDYCKYGIREGCEDENLEISPIAGRKRISTINSKPSPDSFVTKKRVISVTKKGTPSPKKVSKEVGVPKEESIHLRKKRGQFEPSSEVKSPVSHEPSPDSEAHILNKSFVTEKRVVSVTKKGTVSLEKEIDVTMEDSMDLGEEPEQLESYSLPGSVQSLRNSKVISTVSPRPYPGSAAMEKKVISVKKKDTASSKNEMPSLKEIYVSMEEQGLRHKRNIGTRNSKEAPDGSSSGGNRSIRNHNRRASLPGEKQTMGLQHVSLSSKHFNKRDSNVNTGSSYNLKGLTHLKDQNDPGKVEPQPPSDKETPEKILYVIESSTENGTMESTPNGVSVPEPSPSSAVSVEGKGKSLKHARKGTGRTGSSPSSEKKNLKRVVNGADSRLAGPLDRDNKGLRRTRRGTPASLSPSSSLSSMSIYSSDSTQHKENGAHSQHDRSKNVKPIGKSKVQHKTTPRRAAIVGSGNKNSVSRKLTFQRGRVIELQPENNTPRRLKFRRVRSAMEVPNSKGSITSGRIGRKEVDDIQSTGAGIIKKGSNVRKEVGNRQSSGAGIKTVSIVRKEVGDTQSSGVAIKRGIIGRKEVYDNQTNGAKLKSEKVVLRNQEQVEVSSRKSLTRKGVAVGLLNGIRSNPEKVVLRHQDVKGKKGDQKLFNNVIEETASKLVETRKSKVKALVGAFETVISLQDTRPAAAADAC